MPRGGPPNYTYTLPAIYLAVPGAVILSASHNTPLEDIEDVLNQAWPVVIGGTGGTSVTTSWDSINARGADVPTAATLDLDSVTGPNIHLTGTTGVTAVTLANGRVREVIADSAFAMTASASLVVNGATSGVQSIPAKSVLLFIGQTAGIVNVAVVSSNFFSGGGYTTTPTAAGTTTLTSASTYQQYFTGLTTQTVVLPDAATMKLGAGFRVVVNATGPVTINAADASTLLVMRQGTTAIITCTLASGTTTASWSFSYIEALQNVVNVVGFQGWGTNTNDNAPSGIIGEVLSSTVLSGSAVSLTTNTAANVTSLALTAGDWEVYGNVGFVTAASTSLTILAQSISQTTNTLDTAPGVYASQFMNATVPTASAVRNVFTPTVTRISLASTTTVYLVAFATFTASTLLAYGKIYARRAR